MQNSAQYKNWQTLGRVKLKRLNRTEWPQSRVSSTDVKIKPAFYIVINSSVTVLFIICIHLNWWHVCVTKDQFGVYLRSIMNITT